MSCRIVRRHFIIFRVAASSGYGFSAHTRVLEFLRIRPEGEESRRRPHAASVRLRDVAAGLVQRTNTSRMNPVMSEGFHVSSAIKYTGFSVIKAAELQIWKLQ